MLATLLPLLVAAAATGLAPDLGSIRAAFQKRNPKLSTVQLIARQAVDEHFTIAVAAAWGDARAGAVESWFGVFAVAGPENRVGSVLDIGIAPKCCGPKLRRATAHGAYIDWFSDYGMYGGSYKYVYDLSKKTPAQRWAYIRFNARSARVAPGRITFGGLYEANADLGAEHAGFKITLLYRTAERRWTIRDGGDDIQSEPVDVIRLKSGRTLKVKGQTPGHGAGDSGVEVGDGKSTRFYPVPVPTPALHRQMRKERANEIENYIGPHAFDGEKLWFANKFYNGEGVSGVGAIGTFNPATGRYRMRYLPEIAPWSGSALLVNGESVWIGLMRQPEGSAYGGGLLRFDNATGEVRNYPVPGYISTISQVGAVVYLGAENGIYTLDTGTDELTHITVEPGPEGPRTLVIERAGPSLPA
jgi:hypothetical protein